jgi:ribonuclease P protein component
VLRRDGLWVRSVRTGTADEPPRVAYALGRSIGTAPRRNRIRRRLRAAVRECAPELEPGRAYLFGTRPATAVMPYRDLVGCVEYLLRGARESR